MLILWGYISPKLARLTSQYYTYLPKKSFIIHINTCDQGPQNQQVFIPPFNINSKLACGIFDQAHVGRILKEARQCLQA